MANKLNEKQKRFCEEYLIDLNAAAAARRAGYSEKTATEMGYENLRKPHIKQYIDKIKKERSKRTMADADFIVKNLINMIGSDVSDFGTIRGDEFKVKKLEDIPKRLRMIIQEIKPTAYGLSIRLCDKMKALEMLARHINLFEKEIETGASKEQVFKIGDTEIKF